MRLAVGMAVLLMSFVYPSLTTSMNQYSPSCKFEGPTIFRAACLREHNQPLRIYTLFVNYPLQIGQVLVQVCCSGICGAQLGEIAGVKGPDEYMPHLLGHEGAGIVRQIGPGVTHVDVGDHVAMHWRKGLGIESKPPRYHYVPTVEAPCPTGLSIGGGSVTTFNEMAVVSENRLTKIADDVPFEVAALLGCAVTTGLGLITREAQLQIGESLAVFGCGGVGLNVIQGAALASANPIIGIDVVQEKLDMARRFGAHHVINNAIDPWKTEGIVRAWPSTIPQPEVAVDTTGNPGVIESAFDLLAPGGRLFLVGQVRHDQHIRIQTLAMHAGKRIATSDGGLTNPSVDIPRYLRLWKAGKLLLEPLITHRCGLDDINKMLDSIRAGIVGRAIITMG